MQLPYAECISGQVGAGQGEKLRVATSGTTSLYGWNEDDLFLGTLTERLPSYPGWYVRRFAEDGPIDLHMTSRIAREVNLQIR